MQAINATSSSALASLAASSSGISSDDQDVCPICLDEFEKKIVVARCCGHAFHNKCIEDWKIASAALAVRFRIHEHVPDCPTCQSELIIDNNSRSEVKTADLQPIDIETPQGKQNPRVRQTSFSAEEPGRVPLTGSPLPIPPDAEVPLDLEIQVTLEASIRNRTFPLTQRLINDHGAILTTDLLQVALEKAAETLNAHQVGCLLELSSSDPASQGVARTVLGNVLQKAIPRALKMSPYNFSQLVTFAKAFFNRGIQEPELVNTVMQISVQRSQLHLAKEFKSVYGGQLDIATLAAALQQSAQQRDVRKAQKLLELVMPDETARNIGRKILAEELQSILPQAEGMGMMKFDGIMALTRLFFRHDIVDIELANMALKICVLRLELKSAQEYKTLYGAKLETTTFQTVLQKMARTLNTGKTNMLLKLVMPDPAARTIAREVLAEVLQNTLPQAEGMGMMKFDGIMAFTRLFFRHDIVDIELANMALKICVLRLELKSAQEYKTLYGAKLETTTFQTVLQKMARTLNTGKTNMLLKLVMPDPAAQTIAREILAEVLQNALPRAVGMSMMQFGEIMAFTQLLFRHGIVNSALIDTAMRFCILRGEPKQAQGIKAQFGAFVDKTDQAVGSSHQANPPLLQPALDKDRLRARLLEAIQSSNINTVYWLKNQAAMHDIVSPATWQEVRQEALNVALDCENPDIVAALLS